MDATLWQMVTALYEVVRDRDQLRATVAALEERVTQLESEHEATDGPTAAA